MKKGDKNGMKTLPELLAPAGSWDALRAAVGAGADAVYLGGKRFSARASADNFDDAQLISALEYAHRADVRVYVTVNTLLSEGELSEAVRFLLFLYEQGVDGVLVQDMGLFDFARQMIPDLPLHGSTQMTLHNSAGVQWAQDRGIRRVVLARELSAEEITTIAGRLRKHRTGLEIFIHGALCYSYSGQCLLSSSIGGRSANRGRCAQPCRKSYVLAHGSPDAYDRILHPYIVSAPSYCLSTRDLSSYLHLDEIIALPVDALKIEGRMKSPEYVGTVVRIYRAAIDGIRAGTWSPNKEDIRDLLLAFNRGFTAGHLFGESLTGATRPDHQGLLIGRVEDYDLSTHTIKVRLTGDTVPEKGDGIHIVAEGGEERGLRITRSPVRSTSFLYIPCPEAVKPASLVFITYRASLDRAVAEAIKRPYFRQIPIELQVLWRDRRVIFEGKVYTREGEFLFRYESPQVWEVAEKRPLTPKQIVNQLQKSGGTPFTLHIYELHYPGDLFLPLSAVNLIRRDFLSYIGSLIHEHHRPSPEMRRRAQQQIASFHTRSSPPVRPGEPQLSTYVTTTKGVRAAIEGGNDRICLEAGSDEVSESAVLCREEEIPLVWIWPRIIREAVQDDWLDRLRLVKDSDLAGIMVAGAGIAQAIRNVSPDIRLWGSMDLNIWNHRTVGVLAPLFQTLVLSPELSLDQMKDLVYALPSESPSLEYIVQGNLEVVVSENCTKGRMDGSEENAWGLFDVRDRFFPLVIDANGRTHIYNAVETCYIDHLHALRKIGIDSFAIDGRHRNPQYVREITSLYREALWRIQKGDADCTDLKKEIQTRSRGGITLGPLLKGLKEEE